MLRFKSVRELYSAPAPSVRFQIEELMPAGGLTFLIGKPKCGKSTLARQAIVSVALGAPFLGFPTVQASVRYLALEERWDEVRRHYLELGLPDESPVETHDGPVEPRWLEFLCEDLKKNPQVKLVVIDPILSAVKVKDANEYAPMLEALGRLRTVAREFEVSMLCVHHSKKNQSADAGDNFLGSTAMRAAVDATWQIIRKEDGTRTFQTEMRYGKDMPPCHLLFDEETHSSRLSEAEAFTERRKVASARERIEQSITDVLTVTPGATRDEIFASVQGNATLKNDVFRSLEDEGLLVATGAGVRGDPKRYSVAIPAEPEETYEPV